MLSSSFDGVSTLPHFSQHIFMSFQFPISRSVDGNPFFQQIENHLADGVDLIGIGVFQHSPTSISIGFFENASQERSLTT